MSKHHKRVRIKYREVYEAHYGEIPEGYQIHHIDGNPYNNDISNLMAVSPDDHVKLHTYQKKHHVKTKRPAGRKKSAYKNIKKRGSLQKRRYLYKSGGSTQNSRLPRV